MINFVHETIRTLSSTVLKHKKEIERLTTLASAWKESRDVRVREHLSDKAEIERLRAVLEELACLGNGDRYGNSDGNMIAQKALKQSEKVR